MFLRGALLGSRFLAVGRGDILALGRFAFVRGSVRVLAGFGRAFGGVLGGGVCHKKEGNVIRIL
jgi:hypothetical protein